MIRRWVMLAVACVVVQACSSTADARLSAAPGCRPVDSSWAIQIHAIDAASRRPVANLRTDLLLRGAETDSGGWACLRNNAQPSETLSVTRRGYEPQTIVVSRRTSDVVQRELLLQRVPRPCCDLRGRWRITMLLVKAAEMHPDPSGRKVSGDVELGPRIVAPEDGDDLDSLVLVRRGLHRVDFTPFFGGPVAPDVSRSVFGSGPDLLHEVEATAVGGNDVEMRFIPRMSHGSISFKGRVTGDAVLGRWVQSAMGGGAFGLFEMVRVGSVDTTPPVAPPVPSVRERRIGLPPAEVPAGTVPCKRWRPALAVAPRGELWLACGGLFVADSVHGAWSRVLGGTTDAIEADELRSGITLAFTDAGSILLGLRHRYPNTSAPVVYRSADGGAHWAASLLPDVDAVQALGAIGNSVWLVPQDSYHSPARILASDDGGRTWRGLPVPDRMRDAMYLYRVSRDMAFVATHGDSGSAGLWRTDDAGLHWTPLPTPHDQGLHHVAPGYVRVHEIAVVGRWLVVTELGRVFARPLDEPRWRPLPGVDHVASEPGRPLLFALTDSLRPVMLDGALHVVWQAPTVVESEDDGDVEDVVMHDGIGYVSFTDGNVLQAGPSENMQWLASAPRRPRTRRDEDVHIPALRP